MPPLFLGYQRRWAEDQSRVKVAEKSRQIGLTWATAGWCVLMRAATGIRDVWYMSYSEEASKEFIRDCLTWSEAFNVGAKDLGMVVLETNDEGEAKGVRAFQIAFPSGKRITALASSPRTLRGKRGLVIIDEAAFHDDLGELLKAAFALLMWGGEVWVISTHNGVDNDFNQLIEDTRAGKFDYSLHRITLDDAIQDGLYKRICFTTGQEWSPDAEATWIANLRRRYGEGAAEELDCVPSKGGVAYFSREVVESRMVQGRPVVRLYLEPDFVSWPEKDRVAHVDAWIKAEVAPLLERLPKLPHYLGYDFGRTADLSNCTPMTLRKDLVRDVPFVLELGNVPFEQQRQVAFFVMDRLPEFSGARIDATGNGSYLAEVCAQRYGDTVEQVKITEKWHAEEWAPLRAGLEDGKVLFPSDLDLRNDFAAVKRVNGIPKLPTATQVSAAANGTGGKLRRHGDFAVACALAYGVSRKGEAELARWNALTSF